MQPDRYLVIDFEATCRDRGTVPREHMAFDKKPRTGDAMRRVVPGFDGTQHRGIDDARNIARRLPFIVGD